MSWLPYGVINDNNDNNNTALCVPPPPPPHFVTLSAVTNYVLAITTRFLASISGATFYI